MLFNFGLNWIRCSNPNKPDGLNVEIYVTLGLSIQSLWAA